MSKIKRMLYIKFARKTNNGNVTTVPSIISEGTELKGDVNSKGMVHIDGKLIGNVNCDELVIGTNGYVKGYVNAKKIQIYGVFEGTADADDLYIAQNAKLIGDINHITLAIEPGAYIDGRCIRKNREVNALTAPSKTDLQLVSPEMSKKIQKK